MFLDPTTDGSTLVGNGPHERWHLLIRGVRMAHRPAAELSNVNAIFPLLPMRRFLFSASVTVHWYLVVKVTAGREYPPSSSRSTQRTKCSHDSSPGIENAPSVEA